MTLHPDYGLLLIQEIKIMLNLFLITHRIVKYKSLYYSARKNKYKFARKFKLHNDPIAFEIFLFAIKSKKYKRHHLDLEKNNYSKENLAYINYIFSIKEQEYSCN